MILEILDKLNFKIIKRGSNLFIYSPFRDETEPSLCIYPETDSWYDFGGGEGGGCIKFIQKLFNCDKKEAVKKIKQLLETNDLNFHSLSEQNKKDSPPPDLYLQFAIDNTEIGERFFKNMCLPSIHASLWRVLKIGNLFYIAFFCPDPNKMKSLELRQISETGEDLKIRKCIGKKYPWIVRFKNAPYVLLVTESITDSLAGYKCFVKPVSLCALNGVNNYKYLPEIIETYFPNVKAIILALDNDKAGRETTKKILEMDFFQKLKNNIKIVSFPDNVKDFFNLLQKKIKEGTCSQN